MNRGRIPLLGLIAVVLCCAAMFGCARNRDVVSGVAIAQNEHDRRLIMDDPRLSNAQKGQALLQLQMRLQKEQQYPAVTAPGRPPNSIDFGPSFVMVGMSVACLLVVAVVKRRSARQFAAHTALKRRAAVKKPFAVPASRPSPPPVDRPSDDAAIGRPELSVERPRHLPQSQGDVDAIAEAARGVSYFTSRPVPKSMLVEVEVVIGDDVETVLATAQEADRMRAGQAPLIRAFTINGETRPWFDWPTYDPYIHYWAAESSEWLNLGVGVIASWLTLDALALKRRTAADYADMDNAIGGQAVRSGFGAKKTNRLPFFVVRARRNRPSQLKKRHFRQMAKSDSAFDTPLDHALRELGDVRAELLNEKIDLTRLRRELDILANASARATLEDDIEIVEFQIEALEKRERALIDAASKLRAAIAIRHSPKRGAPAAQLSGSIVAANKPMPPNRRIIPFIVSGTKRYRPLTVELETGGDDPAAVNWVIEQGVELDIAPSGHVDGHFDDV